MENAKLKNQEALTRIDAEIARLNATIPARLAEGEDVAELLAALDGLQREKRFRVQAIKVLDQAEKQAFIIARKKERIAALEVCKETAKAQQAAFMKAYDEILALFQKAEAKRLALMEAMLKGGFNDIQDHPGHVSYCDIGQLMRTFAHAGGNFSAFTSEVRSKLENLPTAFDESLANERKTLAALEGESYAVETL